MCGLSQQSYIITNMAFSGESLTYQGAEIEMELECMPETFGGMSC